MKKFTSLLLASTFIVSAAGASELSDEPLELFSALPSTVPNVADNPTSPEKVDLGRALFFDPRLSASGVFSCYSCHNLTTGGDDNLETSIGHGWQKGPRNSPTVFNSVLNEAQFWDGRADDLKAQAKGPIQAGVEMANTPENVVVTLNSMPRAIESFEATLMTPAPFDAYLNGDETALNEMETAGLDLFIENGCASCHSGVNVGRHGYYPFGLVENPGLMCCLPVTKVALL